MHNDPQLTKRRAGRELYQQRANLVQEVRETVRKCGWHARVTQSSSHVNLSNLMKQHQQ